MALLFGQFNLTLELFASAVVVGDTRVERLLQLLNLLLLLADVLFGLLKFLVALVGLTIHFALHTRDALLGLQNLLFLEHLAFFCGIGQGLFMSFFED